MGSRITFHRTTTLLNASNDTNHLKITPFFRLLVFLRIFGANLGAIEAL